MNTIRITDNSVLETSQGRARLVVGRVKYELPGRFRGNYANGYARCLRDLIEHTALTPEKVLEAFISTD